MDLQERLQSWKGKRVVVNFNVYDADTRQCYSKTGTLKEVNRDYIVIVSGGDREVIVNFPSVTCIYLE